MDHMSRQPDFIMSNTVTNYTLVSESITKKDTTDGPGVQFVLCIRSEIRIAGGTKDLECSEIRWFMKEKFIRRKHVKRLTWHSVN
jgi:hypothetical protein